MHDIQKKLAMLDELKGFLAEKGGEDMRGMSMDEDEDSGFGPPPSGDEKPALAIAIEAPPKPPSPGGGEDIDSLIAQGLTSSDPTVKKMAEALSKAKKPGGM